VELVVQVVQVVVEQEVQTLLEVMEKSTKEVQVEEAVVQEPTLQDLVEKELL
jgi:hypothetical protein